jgi:lipoprotein-anchoring transpeptidase ErfK/SrfK
VSSAYSSRRRSPASLVACLALALLFFAGGARAGVSVDSVRVDSVPRAGTIVWSQVAVRTKPDLKSARKALLTQFRPDFRPRPVLAVATRYGTNGKPAWYRVSIPGRPNNRTGWVPAASLEVKPIFKEIVIDVSERRLDFRDHGKLVLRTTVAVGAPGMPTPLGLFYVVARYVPDNSFLGVFAFETSAYSSLSDWPGGGIVGIHGTSLPQLLGQAVSHGCVRVANEAILKLRQMVPVGTPIRIVA